MRKIAVLDQNTIDKIAAGEVVERPASVVKELVENAVDAGSTAITVEIKDGGISFIRVTDNGGGIVKEQVPMAFLRHATSKIEKVDDLYWISSLGFRGEALSSISAVSQMEVITKTQESLMGVRYIIEGGIEKSLEEIGSPNGTTMIVRNLFYNTPARSKFLKTAMTEAGYVSSFMEQLALSHQNISFKYMINGQTRLHTSGNGNLKDVIYGIYGRDITRELVPVSVDKPGISIKGFIGKPVIARGNRNFENYYINGRYVKSKVLMSAIEDAYKPFMMQHKYPFTCLQYTMDGEGLDVNVHPTKMDVRFQNQAAVYNATYDLITSALEGKELIPKVTVEQKEEKKEPQKEVQIVKPLPVPEPFETEYKKQVEVLNKSDVSSVIREETPKQMELFDDKFLSKKAKEYHRIIGQVFDTYWLVEYQDKFYIIDQHAAHEKVLYERFMKKFANRQVISQMVSPPQLISLSLQQDTLLKEHMGIFEELGFEISEFGGKEYSIHSVPADLYGCSVQEFFVELLDNLANDTPRNVSEALMGKIATAACKAAVKGNHKLSKTEVEQLIDELLELENPYHCPHGRPTIISMTKYELEKKFKRIV